MNYRVSGRVIKGQAYGRKIGFPTANLDRRQYLREHGHIPFGIYAGTAQVESKKNKVESRKYRAGIVIGPLDRSGHPKIEAHLIGFKGNLYGKKLDLEIKKFLRRFKKYSGEQELKLAIQKDILKIKKLKF